ncbi:MAG: hypothetical protein JOS17DRAFT_582387 [Linnemannia elongata]|nr:MAG: hypothetical protein JOS17DRAFT_582387 [Linnemannia elongata]
MYAMHVLTCLCAILVLVKHPYASMMFRMFVPFRLQFYSSTEHSCKSFCLLSLSSLFPIPSYPPSLPQFSPSVPVSLQPPTGQETSSPFIIIFLTSLLFKIILPFPLSSTHHPLNSPTQLTHSTHPLNSLTPTHFYSLLLTPTHSYSHTHTHPYTPSSFTPTHPTTPPLSP